MMGQEGASGQEQPRMNFVFACSGAADVGDISDLALLGMKKGKTPPTEQNIAIVADAARAACATR